MSSPADATIIPITLTVNGRTGVTLWAPPWEDEDGDEWHGFLGDGSKILVYASVDELLEFIDSGEEHDLSDHPAWGQVLKLPPAALTPGSEDAYDLDQVYEWAAGEPDPVEVSALANVVDMVAKIADCCDDGALRRLVENTPAYEELVDENNSYQGKDGRRRWDELGDTIAESWERAIGRVESWISWQGDFTAVEAEDGAEADDDTDDVDTDDDDTDDVDTDDVDTDDVAAEDVAAEDIAEEQAEADEDAAADAEDSDAAADAEDSDAEDSDRDKP